MTVLPVWWRGFALPPHNRPLHALGGGIPDQFVYLQAEPRRDVVVENPLGEFLRVKKTMRSVSRAGSAFLERG